LFILVNSVAGVLGQISRDAFQPDLSRNWPLLVAVLLGGQLGSWWSANWISEKWVRWMSALVVFIAGFRMLMKEWI